MSHQSSLPSLMNSMRWYSPTSTSNSARGLLQRRHRAAHFRVGLDLRAEILVHHLLRAGVGSRRFKDTRVRVGQQIPRVGIDQDELLLDAKHDRQFGAVLERIMIEASFWKRPAPQATAPKRGESYNGDALLSHWAVNRDESIAIDGVCW